MSLSENNPFSKLSKQAKIALLVTGWILLLGIAAGVAFLLKPAPEIVYTDAIIEAYKFSAQGTSEVTDTVNDLDYYGYYTANPLTFTTIEDGKAKGAYIVSGLKNKTVEEKINRRIQEAASTLYDISPERDGINMKIAANYFNILSFTLEQYDFDAGSWQNDYFTFDLNTGEELSFDNLFSANLNLTPLLFKSFYDTLSMNLQFAKLSANRRLASEKDFPDPSKCMTMYCPDPGETYDSIRALIAEYDRRLANVEQTAINTVQDYLAGEKKFYLNSYGPVFILSDGTAVEMELKDNIRYAVYLKNYRTSDSIFEDGAANPSNPFFTEIPTQYMNYLNEETDTYLFDYAESTSTEEGISPEIRQALREYLKNKGFSAPGEEGKFRHISANGNATIWGDIRIGYATICVYETDKSYYDSTYRRAIIDEKTQRHWLAPAKAGHYDQDRVKLLPVDGNTESCYRQKNVAITNSGTVIEDVDGVLINPQGFESWKERFNREAYSSICNRSWDPKCYTEAEKQSHELIYSFAGGAGITINLKDDSETGSSYFYTVGLESIPQQYFNPEILVKK